VTVGYIFCYEASQIQKQIEWLTKCWTIVSDLLILTYWYRNDSFREALTTGILLKEICNTILLVLWLCNNFSDTLTSLIYFLFSILKSYQSVLYTSFYEKWPASCHVFVKWPVGGWTTLDEKNQGCFAVLGSPTIEFLHLHCAPSFRPIWWR